jgi:hypothetical protein
MLEQPVICRELNHGATDSVPADHVAGLEQAMQQSARLSAGIEGKISDRHSVEPLPFRRVRRA